MLAVATPGVGLALMLALSGQRQGDLLRRRGRHTTAHIRLRQSKTGRRVVMPVRQPLKVLLDADERAGPIMLTNVHGHPWTSDGFRASWGKACSNAGISGLTFHDPRGTAVVRLALAEAVAPKIATFGSRLRWKLRPVD